MLLCAPTTKKGRPNENIFGFGLANFPGPGGLGYTEKKTMKPKIVITVEGGCVQNIMTNMPEAPEVIVIDYDTEEFTGHQVDGHDVNVGEFTPEFMPEHVNALIAEAQEEREAPADP